MQDGVRLSRMGTFAYCAYAVPLTAVTAAALTLVPPLYSQQFGMSLAQVGFVMFIIRLIDAVTDPLIGLAIDRSPFRQQHKPWIFVTFPIFLIGLTLLLFPVGTLVGPFYLFCALLLTYMAYTIALISHQAWGASLARDQAHMSRLFGLREIAVIFGILGTFSMMALAEQLGGGALTVKTATAGAFILAMLVVATTITGRFAPDPHRTDDHEHESYRQYRGFLLSPHFVTVCGAALLYNFGMVAGSVLSYFIADKVFGSGARYALGQMIYFIAAWIGMVGWIRLAARVGDGTTLVISSIFSVLAFGGLLFWSQIASPTAYFIHSSVIGLGFGAGPYLVRSLTGTLAKRHEVATGQRVRGIAYSIVTFFDKLGSGLAAGIVLPLVAWLGFDPTGAKTSSGQLALLAAAVAFPALAYAVIAVATRMSGMSALETADAKHVA